MATYTKVGRIRPDYADVWDSARSYTALQIVKSADNYQAYIARKDVPAGTSLTDADYWGVVLDVSDVIAESVAATNAANAARENIQSDLAAVRNNKGDAIVCTAEGEVIALTDSSDMPLRGLRIFGKTTQDGTPTPENPVPLVSVGDKGSVGVSVCGKNLANAEITSNGAIVRADVNLVAGETYTLSVSKPPIGLYFTDINNTEINYALNYNQNSLTYTPEKTGRYLVRAYYADNSGDMGCGLMLERGSVATEYEPYKPAQTLTTQTPNGLLGIEVKDGGYADENGQQWNSDEIDYERVVYAKRVNSVVFDGTETWYYIAHNATYYLLHVPVEAAIVPDGERAYGLCTHATHANGKSVNSLIENDFVVNASIYFNIHQGGNTYTSAEEWKDYLAAQYAAGTPVIVQYILATPTETPLTAEEIAAYRALHTNYPNTTIYSDAGAHMEVGYVADTKNYIDNKFNALAAALINKE